MDNDRLITHSDPAYQRWWAAIADDGGGRGYLLRCDGTAGPVFRVGLGSLDEGDFEIVASGFAGWQAAGFPPGS